MTKKTFLEFFAGGGMARLGLGDSWQCLMANDIDADKCAAYRANFGDADLIEGDIAAITYDRLPREAVDLAWGSFPCQDLSLAGTRNGMKGTRSGAFFPFWDLIQTLVDQGRAPGIIAIENVTGLLSSNQGRDLAHVIANLQEAGYTTTAMVLDAKAFTPQSRPRLFILGFAPVLKDRVATMASAQPSEGAAIPPALMQAVSTFPTQTQKQWVWLNESPTQGRNTRLSHIIEWDAPVWHSQSRRRL